MLLTELKIFEQAAWEADRAVRFEIGPLTRSFHRSVPVLGYLNWTIEEIDRGRAVTRLPLNVQSSNQYITQQAALMLLAADYTGGIALSTLFKETPIIGFHAQANEDGAYLWGAAAEIKWLRPSTDDLICKSTIPERDWDDISRRFERGEEINYTAKIKMYSGGRIAAVSNFKYWARNSRSLRATGGSLRSTHHMLAHKLKTSAKLIAGLRSQIRAGGYQLDPFASDAAGAQGNAMANKFSIDSPQLAKLVEARTIHCDTALSAFSRRHKRFLVINIGCGYDSRAWRMRALGGATFVELDLPIMIEDRVRMLPKIEQSPYQILRGSFDILTSSLTTVLDETVAPRDVPIFVIWEGGSMYFSPSQTAALFKQINSLMNSDSQFWFDFVSEDAVNDSTGIMEIKAFIDHMRSVGEPFVQGFNAVDLPLSRLGFEVIQRNSAAALLGETDPIYAHYSFALCEAQPFGQRHGLQSTDCNVGSSACLVFSEQTNR